VVALNRVYAIYKVHGPYAALIELDEVEPLNSHFYFTLLGELYKSIDKEKAGAHFRTAYNLAKTKNDKDIIQVKLDEL
jgi:RNA polymerase sigma-70 factor (ECF subfamily)